MAESILLEVRRGSIPCAQYFQNVTREDLERQAAEIVKVRAEADEREAQNEMSNSEIGQRAMMKRKISLFARSLTDSFATTRGSLKRSFSTSNRTSARISAPTVAIPLHREQDKHHRHALHIRLLAVLTTTIEPSDVMPKLITLYMSPDFPPYMFDEILSLRILESITMIISPPLTSVKPLSRKPAKPQPSSNAFKDARKESEGKVQRFWYTLCRNRSGKGEKEPSAEVKTKITALGIMAVMWPRGVKALGFMNLKYVRCEEDSWAFHFCNRPGKETLGCGLFHFFAALGLWDEERYQPRPGDLAQNGIEVRDFAVTNAMRR